jgi:hypothetical protein
MKRKSLIEAVSPEAARDFIQAGTLKSQFVQTDSKEATAEAKGGEAMPPGLLETKAVEQRSEAEQPAKKRMPKQVTEEGEESPLPILVPQTYRLPQRLVEDLARAAMERKIKRRKPWSQQDIVAEAIGEWLSHHASK